MVRAHCSVTRYLMRCIRSNVFFNSSEHSYQLWSETVSRKQGDRFSRKSHWFYCFVVWLKSGLNYTKGEKIRRVYFFELWIYFSNLKSNIAIVYTLKTLSKILLISNYHFCYLINLYWPPRPHHHGKTDLTKWYLRNVGNPFAFGMRRFLMLFTVRERYPPFRGVFAYLSLCLLLFLLLKNIARLLSTPSPSPSPLTPLPRSLIQLMRLTLCVWRFLVVVAWYTKCVNLTRGKFSVGRLFPGPYEVERALIKRPFTFVYMPCDWKTKQWTTQDKQCRNPDNIWSYSSQGAIKKKCLDALQDLSIYPRLAKKKKMKTDPLPLEASQLKTDWNNT